MSRTAYHEMRQVEPEVYKSDNGFVMRRERGLTPNGNEIGGHWVLRDKDGNWVDYHQYRNDLFEHPALKVVKDNAENSVK